MGLEVGSYRANRKVSFFFTLALLSIAGAAFAYFSSGGREEDHGCDQDGCWTSGKKVKKKPSYFSVSSPQLNLSIFTRNRLEFIQPEIILSSLCDSASEPFLDSKARSIAAQIRRMDSKVEHGTFIVVDENGNYYGFEPVSGNNGFIDTRIMIEAIEVAGYNEADIVGLVHNHTPDSVSATNDRNRGPSWDGRTDYTDQDPGSGDYAAIAYVRREAINNHGGNVDEFNLRFTFYIIGPDGELYEWNGALPSEELSDQKITDEEADAAQKDAESKC